MSGSYRVILSLLVCVSGTKREGECKIRPNNDDMMLCQWVCGAKTQETCEQRYHGTLCCSWVLPEAICNVKNGNNVSGAGCACADGYDGAIYRGSDETSGSCSKVDCGTGTNYMYPYKLPFLNHVDGPECDCADGYSGKVSWDVDRGWGDHGEGWTGPEKYWGRQGTLYWKCFEAPCAVANSNRKSGPECACLEGYLGNITWSPREPDCACADEGPACSCAGSWKGNCTAPEALAAAGVGEASGRGTALGAPHALLILAGSAGAATVVARLRRLPLQSEALPLRSGAPLLN